MRREILHVDLDDIHHLQQRRELALVPAEVIQGERVPGGFERAAAFDQGAVHLHRLQNFQHDLARRQPLDNFAHEQRRA